MGPAPKARRWLETHIGAFRLFLVLLLLCGFVTSLWQLQRARSQITEQSTLEHAQRYSEALAAFRTLYTASVVAKAEANGLIVSHDHKDRPDAIPLPATLTHELGELMAAEQNGVSVRLYSDYPFPWRTDGGPSDGFERRALTQLRNNPSEPYHEVQTINGESVLRFATADRMRQACVTCHNTHPDTPRKGWKVGDVRGVLSTSRPLAMAGASAAVSLAAPAASLAATFLLAIALLVVFRRSDQEQRRALAKSNAELKESTIQGLLAVAEARAARPKERGQGESGEG